MEKKCIVCSCRLVRRQTKFCSRKCQAKYYYSINKEKIKALVRAWERKHPERIREIRKKAFAKFYSQKRERFNELMLRNYRKNKQKWRLRKRHHYHRKKILNAFDNKCDLCESKNNLEIHHINYDTPKRKGYNKDLDLSQIRVWCRDCHKEQHKKY